MLNQIQQWLFPNICCLCEHRSQTNRDLCLVCKASLPWSEDRCYQCGLRLEEVNDAIRCTRCREKPPFFDRLCALFSYEEPVTKLVTGLKFGEQLVYGKVLGELLADAINTQWYKKTIHLPEAVLPVPLHEKRLRARGFNQALELLWPIQKQCQIPLLLNACTRIRQTSPQAKLDKTRRQRNVKDAFRVTALPFDHVAIMDDVVTTGSTVAELSRALKAVGVQQVDVWCVCRA